MLTVGTDGSSGWFTPLHATWGGCAMKKRTIIVFAILIDIAILLFAAHRVAIVVGLYSIGFSSEPIAFYMECLPLALSLILLIFLTWKLLVDPRRQ
ncbi:MAG: hypothetical protein J7515_00005 [Caulobacter sp.]|nr:hypothetical protein [Caulobacter sp.]